ncbi:RTC4-like domain, partial [Teratosphaeria destructans]
RDLSAKSRSRPESDERHRSQNLTLLLRRITTRLEVHGAVMSRILGMPAVGPPLLGTVDGKPHASSDDHDDTRQSIQRPGKSEISATGIKITNRFYPVPQGIGSAQRQCPTPPCSNQSVSSRAPQAVAKVKAEPEIGDDPLSSEEDELASLISVQRESSPASRPLIPNGQQYDGVGDQGPEKAGNFKRRPLSAVEPEQKRKAHAELSSDDQAFESHPKRTKTKRCAGNSRTSNIHAISRPKAAYGRAAQKQQEAAKRKKQQEDERREAQKTKEKEEQKPHFQRPKTSIRRSPSPGLTTFKRRSPRIIDDPSSQLSDSPLSEYNSLDDLEELDSTKIECAICGELIPREWKAEFEDTMNKKRQLSYKWQQRFCKYHSEKTARDLWEERGYPDVDWIALRDRLKSRKHLSRLKKILSGEVESTFRSRLQSDQKHGSRSLMNVVKGEKSASKISSAGYYGPRGERLITNAILTHLAPDIRAYETSSTLFSGSGIFGGVAGFVQAVLVPELASSLIAEDLADARIRNDPLDVLEESASLGELIHPEEEDKVDQRIAEESEDVDVYEHH